MWYKDGVVFNSQQDIRKDNPDTSLPSFMSDELICELGYTKVSETPNPANETENGFIDGVELIDNIPYLKWRVEPKTEQELEEIRKIERQLSMEAGQVYVINEKSYVIPFTKDDGDGIVQAYLAFATGDITQTTLHFSNGVEVPVNTETFPPFRSWFVGIRNSYF